MGILDKIKKVADVATAGTQLLDGFRSQNNEESTTVNQLPGSLQSQNDAQDSTASLTSGMYDASLEKLIAIALADGVVSEKGKQVLFKKAESLGIDLDEFEMVLDARILEVQKSQIRTQANSTPSIQHLLVMLSNVGKKDEKKGTNLIGQIVDGVASSSVVGTVVGVVGNMIMGDDKEKDIAAKKNIISNYPVPNVKNNMLEFLSYAVPLAKKKGNFFTGNNPENERHNEFAPVWKTKCEQIITKVKLSMRDDRELMDLVEQYAIELGIKK